MQFKQLGNSGLIVSELCLGTLTFGKGDFHGLKFTIDQKTADRIIGNALENGINFFDTADVYGHGQSEYILGKALGNKRKDVIISTKAAFRTNAVPGNAGVNARYLIQQCEESLKRLNTDYIDIYILHNDDPITPIEETLYTLEYLVKQGKIRYPGISNYSSWKTSTMIQLQKTLNYRPFITAEMHYSIINRDIELEFIPMCKYHGIGILVWSPLSSGFLSGKYTRENPRPTDGRLNTVDMIPFNREIGYDIIEILENISKKHNTTVSAVALRWLLDKSTVSSIIIGVSKEAQLQENIQCINLKLDIEDIIKLDQALPSIAYYPLNFINAQDDVLKNALLFS